MNFGDVTVSRSTACAKLAIMMLTAVALAGCGRKGPLEPPPSASVQPQAAQRGDVAGPAPGTAASQAGALFAPPGEDPAPAAAPGRKKPFILDFLLD